MFDEIVMIDWRRPLSARKAARRVAGPYRWRPSAPNRGRGFYVSSHDAWAADEPGSSLQLRFEPAARHWRGARDWRGDFGFDAWTPIVARLAHGRGFLAGASLGAGMLAFVDPTLFANPRSAAVATDDAAQDAAEADRDDVDQGAEAA
jgi:hypothetical protein